MHTAFRRWGEPDLVLAKPAERRQFMPPVGRSSNQVKPRVKTDFRADRYDGSGDALHKLYALCVAAILHSDPSPSTHSSGKVLQDEGRVGEAEILYQCAGMSATTN